MEGLELGHGGVSGAIASWTTLIPLTKHGGGVEAGLDLCVDRLLDSVVPAIEFLP